VRCEIGSDIIFSEEEKLIIRYDNGDKIQFSGGKLTVPDFPVIPFIVGDGTGPDIWNASVRIFDKAVENAFGGRKKLSGRRFWPERKLLRLPGTGYLRKPWMYFAITL
jgi:hypothetical protein